MILSTSQTAVGQVFSETTFSAYEVEQIRQSFRDRRYGEVLIGLVGVRRNVTIYLPPRVTEAEVIAQLETASRQLADLKCDGWLWARLVRVRTRHKDGLQTSSACSAVLLDESCLSGDKGRVRCQRLCSLDSPRILQRQGDFFTDPSVIALATNLSNQYSAL